jgi:hypothetical protein
VKEEKMAQEDENERKEPFIGSSERPEVKLDLDMPVTELRVRDLAAILGHLGSKSPFEAGKTPIKDFFDKPFPEEAKDFLKEVKIEKFEKPEKPEKFEKNEKFEKYEKHEKPEKLEKIEKREKPEIKEVKLEKLETDGVFEVDRFPPGPDPRFESVIQAIAQLSHQVATLTDQVEQLRKRAEG